MNRSRLLVALVLGAAVLVVSAATAQVWRAAVTPTYPGVSMNDASFINAGTGWVVGSAGVNAVPRGFCYRTTDGGSTWTESIVDSTGSPSTVFFRSAGEGYVGAEKRKFYKSTDGGATWALTVITTIPDTDATINSIVFFDALKGRIMTTRGSSSSANGRIYLTTDGGATWTQELLVTGANMYKLCFTDQNRGVAIGKSVATLYYMKDGATWVKSDSLTLSGATYTRSDIRAVHMVDSLLAYAVGWGSLVGAQASIQIKTTNGGQTWVQQVQSAGNKVYDNLYGVYFKDASNGYAVGSSSRVTTAVKTSDGGVNWVPAPFPAGISLSGLIGSGDSLLTVGGDGAIFRSADFGASWDLCTPHLGAALNAIQIPAPSTIIAAGFDAVGVRSTDGGATWGQGSVWTGTFATNVNDLCFVNGTTGFAAQSYRLVSKTTDLGDSWTVCIPETTASTVYSYGVDFVDNNLGFVVGAYGSSSGVVHKTTDGGATWTTKTAVIAKQLYGVAFANATTGVAVGDSKLGAYTTDGGTTWTASTFNNVPSNRATADFRGVVFLTPTIALAVGDSTIVKSTDAGATWNYVASSAKSQLRGIDAADATTAYAVGQKEVWKTTDAGETWTNIIDTSVVVGALYSVAVDNSGNVWVSAAGGYVYTTSPTVDVTPGPGLPGIYSLDQNYPNPFNPATTISYQVPVAGTVRIAVFDVLGRQVAELLNEKREAGNHTVTWNAAGMASGVYLYRIMAGDFTLTRKMVLVK